MMIDTDKYEGHTIEGSNYNHRLRNDADIQLIADAPLLLAEVKRYRKTLERIAREDYNQNHYEHTEERHIWNMMHNMIQQARMALGQDIDTGELRAEEFGAESCTCNDMFGSLCPQCNYDSDREGGVCPKGCTVDLAGSVRPQEMEIYTECKIHGQKLGAESFGAEFSRGDMLNLRKYVNYPMRWVNKNLRPSSDSKERKTEQKMKGQIPRRKSPDSFRNTIETPTWFKGIQLGILATIFGAMYVSETNKKRKK